MNIIHDFFKYYGGGERLIIGISEYYNSNIYTSFKTKKFDKYTNIKSNNNFIFFFKISRYIFLIFYFLFFIKVDNNNKDTLYSGNFSILSILKLKKKSNKNILYLHSLPKKLFHENYHIEVNFMQKIIYLILKKVFIYFYRSLYTKLDLLIFNSNFTKKNFLIHFKTNAKTKVIYPYFDDNRFNLENTSFKNYFVFNSRHERNKRIDKVLEFFSKNTSFKIFLTNEGSLTPTLKIKYSNFKNIVFCDLLNENEYINLIKNSLATIMIPIQEDFGMSAIEATACGKIVLASKEGGLVEIFGDNYLFYIDNNDFFESFHQLINKIYHLPNKQNPKVTCMNNFTFKSFIFKFEEFLNN